MSFVLGSPLIRPVGVDLARSFNGSSDFIDLGNNDTFLGPTAISISVWVNPSSLSNAYSAIVSRVNSSFSLYQMFIKSTGKPAWYVRATTTISLDPGSHTVSTSAWTHLAMVYDSVNGMATYVNGASDGTVAANGAVSSNWAGIDLTLGKDTSTAGRLLAGSMADIAIWNTNLTPTQIANLAAGRRANNAVIGANANLVGYLPIVGQSPEPDQSGNGNNGTLTGTTVVAGPPTLDPF